MNYYFHFSLLCKKFATRFKAMVKTKVFGYLKKQVISSNFIN